MSAPAKPVPEPTESDKIRFWTYVAKGDPDDCWEWQGHTRSNGHGGFRIGSGSVLTHRVSHVMHHGHCPPDKPHTLHSCDNRKCVNPAHLRAGTPKENVLDREQRDRGHHATGERHSSVTHHDRISRGDNHYSRQHPERMARGDRHGSKVKPERVARGEKQGAAKLNDAKATEIRQLYTAGNISQAALAHQFGVAQATVGCIIRRKSWTHCA